MAPLRDRVQDTERARSSSSTRGYRRETGTGPARTHARTRARTQARAHNRKRAYKATPTRMRDHPPPPPFSFSQHPKPPYRRTCGACAPTKVRLRRRTETRAHVNMTVGVRTIASQPSANGAHPLSLDPKHDCAGAWHPNTFSAKSVAFRASILVPWRCSLLRD